LYVLWGKRNELLRSAAKPSWAGFAASIACYLVALLGTRGLQVRFEQLGFIGLFITIPWAFYGREFAKHFIFPALYLLFTIPLSTFLDAVTIYLRLFASSTALVLLRGFGIDAVQNGTAIVSQGANSFSVDVAEPCSGLRSLFALMALTAAYSWCTLKSWPRRMILFACSVPLAVLGNVVRIISICLVASAFNPDFALGFYHDYSGYIVFIIAISLMVAIGEILVRPERLKRKSDAESSKEESEKYPLSPVKFSYRVLVFAVVLSLLGIFQSSTPPSKIMSAPEVVLPLELEGVKSQGVKFCHQENCARMFYETRLEKGKDICPVCGGKLFEISLGEKTILPADTVLKKRVYTDLSTDFQYLVSAVIGGVSKSSIHRPELCMPAQGFLMSSPCNFDVGTIPFHAIQINTREFPSSVLVYTFFNQTGFRTSSHTRRILTDVWDRSVYNRVDRWVMITVNISSPYSDSGVSTVSQEDLKHIKGFLEKLFNSHFVEGGLK
jgi:exosortase